MTDALITADHGDEADAETARRAIEEKAYGFRLCLVSDAIIFALLFAIFIAMTRDAADVSTERPLLRLPRIFPETMLLLASSATLGFASIAAAARQRWRAIIWLGLTFVLGLGFVVTEILELYGMAAAHAGPWQSGFLSAFFTLIGAHGAHVSLGLIWIALLGGELAWRGPALDHDGFGSNRSKTMSVIDSSILERDAGGKPLHTHPAPGAVSRLHRLSLFWHFLVIVWISIFALVYLPGLL
ncbi:cytochrome bo3 quinol oxidase subunit 3 [Nitrobacter winogradskyi Nb-255]|uniref:Cytochrome bo3 quinol oxidase subunit 3 n=1 Tax=Nitrobacter winogradskyi (strain ATCC 25391 / DSM 10237 / CIP 104748 / NCIMB 11846 / Nb-255) TaxID=323098 RepID=Q3SUK7_NITWN|nr:cytochrome c oxidase subunit 3 [Nitrobacter winogradskyi]ABA04034.1 cytochrome bo3 quinol oxidase subunit 3 [Nitrobacter winogradskyi Nb-255]